MAAPVEDTDMDLVAERLVLLSLPVKEMVHRPKSQIFLLPIIQTSQDSGAHVFSLQFCQS